MECIRNVECILVRVVATDDSLRSTIDQIYRYVDAQRQRRMGKEEEQIRVSDTVKREIERRRREDESYNDVLERLFSIDRDRDLLAGFGRWSEERTDRARKTREDYEEKSIERM